jgi:hypothetical protein
MEKGEKESVVKHEIDITEGAIELDLVDRMHQTKKALFDDYRAVEDCIVKLKFNDNKMWADLEHVPGNSYLEKTYSVGKNGEVIGSFYIGKIREGQVMFEGDFILSVLPFSDSMPPKFEEICYKPLSQEQREFIQYAYSEYQLENKLE